MYSNQLANNYFDRNKKSKDEVTIYSIYLHNLLQNEKLNTIYEIGCFTGSQLGYLCMNFGANGTGIDLSSKSIEYARKKYKNHKFICGDASNLQVDNESQDLVIFGFCLCLMNDDHYKNNMKEALMKVKSGKYLSIIDFDSESTDTCVRDKIVVHKRDHSNIPGLKLLEKKIFYTDNKKHSYDTIYERYSLWLFKKK